MCWSQRRPEARRSLSVEPRGWRLSVLMASRGRSLRSDRSPSGGQEAPSLARISPERQGGGDFSKGFCRSLTGSKSLARQVHLTEAPGIWRVKEPSGSLPRGGAPQHTPAPREPEQKQQPADPERLQSCLTAAPEEAQHPTRCPRRPRSPDSPPQGPAGGAASRSPAGIRRGSCEGSTESELCGLGWGS